MDFSGIHGNKAVVAALAGMVDSGRIPHAMLFHENDGGGAIPVILAFLSYLYCRDRHDGDSCGSCPSCNKISKLIHPDIHFVYPVTGGSKVSSSEKPVSESYVQYWRELVSENPYFYENELYEALGIEGKSGVIAVSEAKAILDKLSLTAVEGGYRSVVIYLPEKMNQAAANSLLKMVEEPPENTLFLMVTHEPEKVLRTIYSRCLFMRILPLSKDELSRVHPRESGEESVMLDIFSDLMSALASRDLVSVLEAGETIAALESREKQKAFCKFAGKCLREIFLLQQGLSRLGDVSESDEEFFRTVSQKCRKTFPRQALALFDRARLLTERNVNQKILFCDLVNRLYTIY